MNERPFNHDENLQKADRIAYLIAGHLNSTLTQPEQDELDDWITESDANLELFEKLTDEDHIEAEMQKRLQLEGGKEKVLTGVKRQLGLKKRSLVYKIVPYLAAASVILITTLFLFRNSIVNQDKEKTVVQAATNTGIAPGSDKAVLTLSDGRTIILDSTGAGVLANDGDISITKTKQGAVVYEGTASATQYNILSTPRGGQFNLTLEDGTVVWLNAESSIKFPAGFAAAERNVDLRGEAYFAVAKNPAKPFRVNIITADGDAGTVEVLGTQFSVNGYRDEGVAKATLLEGSVRITMGEVSKVIKPGEQALINNGIKVVAADVGEETAWKNGKFLFRDATIRSIGEQIKRWYDVEVAYQGVLTQHFNMEVDRSVPLSRLLQLLQKTGQVHFELRGKKLTIKP